MREVDDNTKDKGGSREALKGRQRFTVRLSTQISTVGMFAMRLITYLNYGGNCERAFRFYEQHLGGKIVALVRHSEQPNAQNVPAGWGNAVLNARMSIGETELMGADIPPDRFQQTRSA